MKNKKVAILMSTYNGEKYLKEQMESLISGTYKNVEIYIRDDGSKDNTVKIIKDYKKIYNNINLIEGENIGFIRSFLKLLEVCDTADYYAYCDQDDVWMENKIERAVSYLGQTDDKKPILYFSNSDYYDSNMKFVGKGEKNKYFNFRNSLVECVTQGMTMVINNKTREKIINNKPQNCLFHDWWTYMICSGCGEIIYDDESLVKYRRHTGTCTAEGTNKIKLLIWRIKKFILGDSLKKIREQFKEYEKYFSSELKEDDRKLLKMFTYPKYNFLVAIKKCFYPKRFRKKMIDEVSVRFLFLLGKL